jgi:hypothetical protein
MKRYLITTFAAAFLSSLICFSSEPFKGRFTSKDLNLKLEINLYDESVEVPGMEMFGPLNGYIAGEGLYRTWYISKIRQIEGQKAIVHFSNDLGSETQPVELTLINDSILHFREIEGSVMKKAVGKKLVKITSNFEMKRQ